MASRRFLIGLLVILLSFNAGPAMAARVFDFERSLREDIMSSVPRIFSIKDFGAQGNGKDDTNAFNKAWEQTCSSNNPAVMLVPEDTYLVKPLRFEGPCKSDNITVRILGTLNASDQQSDFNDKHWLIFQQVQNLTVEGDGTINGNGDSWWKKTCKIKKSHPCINEAPTALTFRGCESLVVRDLRVRHSPQMQIAFEKCNYVDVSNVNVTAPGNSPNTDGIHITHTKHITVSNCVIATGDDCISIVSGSQTVRATDITCGPGHGISIGSLGSGNSEAHVSDVIVNRAKFSGSTNGLRIKTWQGGMGNVTNVKYMNVELHNVKNPIIIDQNYCDRSNACAEKSSAVQVSDVLYQNINGTSATDIAINFDCSKSFKCEKIVLQDVHIQKYGDESRQAEASCQNVELTDVGAVTPLCSNVMVSPNSDDHHRHHHHRSHHHHHHHSHQ